MLEPSTWHQRPKHKSARQRRREDRPSKQQYSHQARCFKLTASRFVVAKASQISSNLEKLLAPAITNAAIDDLYGAALEAGALGGKILGAGGGGHLLIYCPTEQRHRIGQEMSRRGGRVVRFAFEEHGLQAWRAQ